MSSAGPGQSPGDGGHEAGAPQHCLLRHDAVQGGQTSARGPAAVHGLGYGGSRPRLLWERPAGISGETEQWN